MRFIFFADLHLNNITTGKIDPETLLPFRVLDVVKNLNLVVETAIEKKVDLVLFGGDAYKTYAPPQEYKVIFHDAMTKLTNHGIKVVLIQGNHDMTKRGSSKHALIEFKSLKTPNVWVTSDAPEVFDFDDFEVVAIGWQAKEFNLPKRNLDKFSICIAHCTLDTAEFYSGVTGETVLGHDFVLPQTYLEQFDWVGLGHIHKPQVISHDPFIGYPGSCEILDWGEVGDAHGFYYYDGKTHHIKYSNRPRYDFTFNSLSEIDQIEIDPEGIYRVKVYCEKGQQPSMTQLRHLGNSFEHKIELIHPRVERERIKGGIKEMNRTQQLELYFKQTGQNFDEVKDLWNEIHDTLGS